MGERPTDRDAPLTVVLPVWNEGANLRPWWEGAAPHLPAGTRVLVVHDRDDDDTIPVARALAAEGAPVRLVRNRRPGFPGALAAGFAEAERGPVLVTMADRSDDLSALPRLLAAYRAGADLVVGSRYAPGGAQHGASPLKAALARWGSAALHRGARFPVRDATNAFRVYDAALARSLRADGTVGFEIVLALLVEAWRSGARIAEVPVTWRGRERGTSRFRMAWIPRYGRLWVAALAHGLSARLRAGEAGR